MRYHSEDGKSDQLSAHQISSLLIQSIDSWPSGAFSGLLDWTNGYICSVNPRYLRYADEALHASKYPTDL